MMYGTLEGNMEFSGQVLFLSLFQYFTYVDGLPIHITITAPLHDISGHVTRAMFIMPALISILFCCCGAIMSRHTVPFKLRLLELNDGKERARLGCLCLAYTAIEVTSYMISVLILCGWMCSVGSETGTAAFRVNGLTAAIVANEKIQKMNYHA